MALRMKPATRKENSEDLKSTSDFRQTCHRACFPIRTKALLIGKTCPQFGKIMKMATLHSPFETVTTSRSSSHPCPAAKQRLPGRTRAPDHLQTFHQLRERRRSARDVERVDRPLRQTAEPGRVPGGSHRLLGSQADVAKQDATKKKFSSAPGGCESIYGGTYLTGMRPRWTHKKTGAFKPRLS